MSPIITEFHAVGICRVDVDLLERTWDRSFELRDYDAPGERTYILTQLARFGQTTQRVIHSLISSEQAEEIIAKLSLARSQCKIFKFKGTWRKLGQEDF